MNIILTYLLILATPFIDNNPKLTVEINNINKIKGSVKVAVFNTDKNFLEKDSAIRNYSLNVDSSSKKIVIDDLPKGVYAIAIYHDVNSDDVCNLNFIGIPKEPYGFSNNFRPKFSAPKFADCKISLVKNQTIKINLVD